MTSTTYYTMQDQAYFYADLHRSPRLSQEEQRTLLASTPPTAVHLDRTARNRLVEGHLGLATHIVIQQCPSSHYSSSFPDILSEVFLALVQTADRYNVRTGEDVTLYLGANAQWAVKRALEKEKFIQVPYQTFTRARAEGRLHEVYALQPLSLDQVMQHFGDAETEEYEEPLTMPLTPTQAAPPRDPVLRRQVEEYLALLSPRAQAVLRLRYGLCDDNERAHTSAEIAHMLGISPGLVTLAERDALTRLKALAAGEARIVTRKGKACISYPAALKPPVLTPAQEHAFVQAATRLCEQGISLSGEHLAQETGMGIQRARAFLRAHRDEVPQAPPRRHRLGNGNGPLNMTRDWNRPTAI